MKLWLNVILLCLMSQVYGWKPISHPAAYTVYQTFPDHANSETVSRSFNAIHKDSVDSLIDSFDKNNYNDDVSKSSS